MKRGWILMTLCMAVASCATVPPPAPGTTSSPMPGRDPVPAPSSTTARTGGSASPMPGAARAPSATAATVPASVDSQPSREAVDVLNTIPEPLSPGERTAAPSKGAIAANIDADEDSAVADSSAVPTPAPTQALGDKPGSLNSAPTSPPSSAPPKAAAPAGAAAAGATAGRSVNPDPCWRVQVGAPPEEDKANALRSAAQSQLQVPVVIELEGGLRKVRTRECVDMATADVLRRRALAAGFEGAFKVKGPAK